MKRASLSTPDGKRALLSRPDGKRVSRLRTAFVWLFWLALWEGVSLFLRQPLLLPSPFSVASRLWELCLTASFWRSVALSSSRILGGFALGCLTGILLAIPSRVSPWVRDLLYPAVATVKAIPVASFVILSLVWLNSRSLSVFIAFLMSLPPIYLGVSEGIGNADKELLEMARVFRVPLARRVTGIYVPAALPAFRTAVSLSLGLCWKAGVAAEVIGLPRGTLGERLYNAKVYFLTADLFAWTVVIISLSVCFERVFLYALNRLSEACGV